MADVRRVVELVFGATDNASKVIGDIGGGISNVSGNLQNLTGPIANATQDFLLLEGAVAAGAVALGVLAVNEASKFESASLDLQKVLGDTNVDVRELEKEAINLSSTFGVSSTQVLGSAADFKQAGFTVEESMNLVKSSVIAANISELEAGEAGTRFIQILKGFNAPASDVQGILDKVNNTTNNFAANFDQLTGALARSAPVASQAGVSLDELIGFVTPAIETFQSGEIAARGFNTVLLRLTDDAKPIKDALAAIGVSQKDANGSLRLGGDILKDVQQAFVGLEEPQRVFISQQLAGIDQTKVALPIFSNLQKTLSITAQAAGSAGSAQAELEIRMKASEVQANITRESIRNMAIAFGTELLPSSTSVVQSIGLLADSLRAGIDADTFDAIINVIKTNLDGLATSIKTVAENLPEALKQVDFGPFATSIDKLIKEVNSNFEGLDITSPEGLAKAIQTVINVSARLVDVTRGILDIFGQAAQKLFEYLGSIKDVDAESAVMVGQFLGVVSVFDKVLGAVDVLGTALTTFSIILGAKGVTGAFTSLFNAATNVNGVLGKAGLVGAVGALSYGTATFVLEQTGATEGMYSWSSAMADWFNGPSKDTIDRLAELQKKNEDTRKAQDELTQSVEEQAPALSRNTELFAEYAQTADNLGLQLTITKDGQVEMVRKTNELTEAVKAVNPILEQAKKSLEEVGISTELAEQGFERLESGVITNVTSLNKFDESSQQAQTELEKTQKELESAAKEAVDFELELAKLNSEQQNLQFQIAADIQVAEIQAQSAIVVAAFESIGDTVASTTDLIGSLANTFTSASSQAERVFLQDLLEDQVAIEREQLELQRQLTEAEIDRIQAQTRALDKGEAFITIQGDGLEPELRAFMFKILGQIQISANAQGQQFLLGLGA